MKRVGVLICAVLALFLISNVNPLAYSIPASIVDEAQEALFLTAADGAESSESLTSFSETLSDNTMMYPDAFNNGTATHSTSGFVVSGVEYNDHTYTHSNDDSYWGVTDPPNELICELWFSSEVTNGVLEGFAFALEFNSVKDLDAFIYNHTASSWVNITFDHAHWANGSTYDPDYWNTTHIGFRINSTDTISDLYVDYAEVTFYELTLADSDHYAESFADVSDCLIMDDEGDDTFSSDGDLLHFESKTDSENDGESVYSNVPSLVGQYLEIRYRLNTTSLAIFAVGTYSSDGGLAGNINWFGMTITTSWTTSKFPINSDTVIESVRLYIYHVTGQPPVDLQVDYLRIGPADEMGWQHDGSTTAGASNDAEAGFTYTTSSDGDVLSCNVSRDSGSGNTFVELRVLFDTTATAIDLERDYYPFWAARVRVSRSSSASQTAYVNLFADGYNSYVSTTVSALVDWTTVHANHKASSSANANEFFRIGGSLDAVDDWINLEVDWCKAYSIANNTVTQSGATIDDYLYVDSGVLYSSIDDGYIELNHDPALSVSDTYSVWNLTTSSTAPEFSQYVSEWSVYSDETRGATTSGTVTDIKLKFDSIETISAIKFIEDGTAPAVVRSSSTPNDPEDDEAVTLSAVITDTIEVYSVKFNAIVYPTGFSDVDYSANEQADNLWNYTFSSLDAGYYCFKIIASDGANTNALTEYAYIELTVREAAIRVEEITLIGAGSDFEMMTFSARINRDCSFTIYEESASSPESDTHTGSVTAPSFNLAWTKLDVDDANVNFTIRFTSGSLTYNYTSQYQVAQTTFYVSTVTQMVSLDTVTVTGRITKLGAYQVYDDLNVLKDYGTLADLDFKVQFTRWGGYDEQNHDFAIKFTNGSQTCWYNSSFYAFKKPVVAAFQTTDPNALYAFQVSFWTLIAVVAVGGMVAVDFYRKEVK